MIIMMYLIVIIGIVTFCMGLLYSSLCIVTRINDVAEMKNFKFFKCSSFVIVPTILYIGISIVAKIIHALF